MNCPNRPPVEAATLATDGSPPITRTTFPTCRAHYPGGSSGCACRLLPRSRGLPRTGAHNAGRLTYEVMVTYPFHPLARQSVLVVGDKEHGAPAPHRRNPGEGARLLLPEWMTFREAGAIQTLSRPRLSVNRLVELRALLDQTHGLIPWNHLPGGGQSNEPMEATPTRPVHHTTTLRPSATSTNDRGETAQDASGGGDLRRCTSKRKDAQSRGGQ